MFPEQILGDVALLQSAREIDGLLDGVPYSLSRGIANRWASRRGSGTHLEELG